MEEPIANGPEIGSDDRWELPYDYRRQKINFGQSSFYLLHFVACSSHCNPSDSDDAVRTRAIFRFKIRDEFFSVTTLKLSCVRADFTEKLERSELKAVERMQIRA